MGWWILLACAGAPPGDTGPPAEVCNGVDDDGDGLVDEGLVAAWYPDEDDDGYGRDGASTLACTAPAGTAATAGDCDDADPAVHPGATETCATAADDDCDGTANGDGAVGCTESWPDADGDGWGEGDPACTCDLEGRVLTGGDCDPTDADRGADCTEGATLPLAGARLLDDDAEVAWVLAGFADLDAAGAPEVLLAGPDAVLAATLPAAGTTADTLLSAATLGRVEAPAGVGRALGDLDGDGLPELLQAELSVEADPDDPYGDYAFVTPVITTWPGPLLADPVAGPGVVLPTFRTTAAYPSLFVAALDPDAPPAAVFASGTSTGNPGEAGVWRIDGEAATELARTDVQGAFAMVAPAGDLDADGLGDLVSVTLRAPSFEVVAYAGPLGDALPDPAAVVLSPEPYGVVGVGDLDADGYDDLAVRGDRVWILRGPLASGDLPELAAARIGAETDDPAESSLFVTAGDVALDGAAPDGARDLVVTDPYWPGRFGAEPLRGALYAFDGLPTGVVDVRAAAVRSYGTTYGALGAAPSVLPDGRVLVGAHLEATEVGMGVFPGWEP